MIVLYKTELLLSDREGLGLERLNSPFLLCASFFPRDTPRGVRVSQSSHSVCCCKLQVITVSSETFDTNTNKKTNKNAKTKTNSNAKNYLVISLSTSSNWQCKLFGNTSNCTSRSGLLI